MQLFINLASFFLAAKKATSWTTRILKGVLILSMNISIFLQILFLFIVDHFFRRRRIQLPVIKQQWDIIHLEGTFKFFFTCIDCVFTRYFPNLLIELLTIEIECLTRSLKCSFREDFEDIWSLTLFCLQVKFQLPAAPTNSVVDLKSSCAPANVLLWLVKFIYSEKAIKFCKISTLLLTGTT